MNNRTPKYDYKIHLYGEFQSRESRLCYQKIKVEMDNYIRMKEQFTKKTGGYINE